MRSFESSSMKQIVMDGDNPFLPEDIIRNILIRLPVKFLIRFQCVCKHWKNLIKTQSFIQDHLHHSTQNSFLLFKGSSTRFCLLNRKLQLFEVPNGRRTNLLSEARIIDSCNGLLCFVLNNPSHPILLFNPALRKARYVSKTLYSFVNVRFSVGFGFSSIVNDYKIVRVHVSTANDLVNKVRVYSLSTGSWKLLEFGNLDGVAFRADGCSTNGAIFWLGFKQGVEEEDGNYCNLIISFDIAMEVFTLIPLPASVPKSHRNRLTVHDDQIALLSLICGDVFSSIDLWVLEEVTGASGGRWRWSRKYTFGPCLGLSLFFPATIWGNKLICNLRCNSAKRKIALFNLTTNEVKKITVGRCTLSYGIFNYMESLVPVRNIHIEEPWP